MDYVDGFSEKPDLTYPSDQQSHERVAENTSVSDANRTNESTKDLSTTSETNQSPSKLKAPTQDTESEKILFFGLFQLIFGVFCAMTLIGSYSWLLEWEIW